MSSPTVTITPAAGGPGTSVTVTGLNFGPGEHLTIKLNANGNLVLVNAAVPLSNTSMGKFTQTFKVPTNATIGVGEINATGTLGAIKHSAVTPFTVQGPTLTVTTPSSATGGPGTSVSVHGTNFGAGEHLTIKLNANGNLLPSSSVVASDGTFTKTFPVPINATTGVGSINATGTLGLAKHSAVTAFTVSSPTVTITPAAGGPGTSVTVTGLNFGPGEHLTIKLNANGNLVVVSAAVPLSNSPMGKFTQTFKVPTNATIGVGEINATGTLGAIKHSAVTPFTVQGPTLTVTTPSSATGGPGTSVSVHGTNFGAGEHLTIKLNANGNLLPSSSVVASDGTFTKTFPVPINATTGVGSINATGTLGLAKHSAVTAFTVSSPTVTITPAAGGPGTSVTVTGLNFGPGEHLTIKLNANGNLVVVSAAVPLSNSPMGKFTQTFKVPTNATIGVGEINATGTLGAIKHSAVTPFTVQGPTITVQHHHVLVAPEYISYSPWY